MAGVLEVLICHGSPTWPPSVDEDARVEVKLEDEFVLVPVSERLRQALRADESEPVLGFEQLTPPLLAVCVAMSQERPVMYLHLEFHGGTGFHAAAIWDVGELVFGPSFTANHPAEMQSDLYRVTRSRNEMAANERLRLLGVRCRPGFDEFTSVGLERHRWTDEWAGTQEGH